MFTGDIKTPVKYAKTELKMLFSQVEQDMVDTFINEEIPEPYKDIYRERLQEGKMIVRGSNFIRSRQN